MFGPQTINFILTFKFDEEHASTAGTYTLAVFKTVFFGFAVSQYAFSLILVW